MPCWSVSPPGLRNRIPAIPPATPRNLWLLLAAAVATQNLGVFQSSQSEHTTVFALLVWGGALICMEDQLEDLEPSPSLFGLIVGGLLLLAVLARTAVILHWEGVLFVLAPWRAWPSACCAPRQASSAGSATPCSACCCCRPST